MSTLMKPKKILLSQLTFSNLLRRNEVIGWPQGPGEPLALTEALLCQRESLNEPTLFFGLTHSETLHPVLAKHFKFRALNGAGTSRRITALADIIPCHVSSIPALIRAGEIRVDVVLIQVKPVSNGGYTLGVIADFTQVLIRNARLVLALVNFALPTTGGDAFVDSADIDILIESDDRLINMPDPEPSEIERFVAKQVAELIPDRATIQLGVGTLPVAVARALSGHQELGVHSGVVSDVLVDLVEQGVVTNTYKGRDAGKTVTGGLFGTQRLRDFAERTGLIEMRSVEYTHNLSVAVGLSLFHTINSAIEIDLSGQVNAEVAGGRYLGAVGGQVDFVRAGLVSPGGRSIIALPSVTLDGKHSRIVETLGNSPVTTARSEVDLIVTEYGAAHLRGCSLRERSERLIEIAHPDHREKLARAFRDRNGNVNSSLST
jgi:acetyl-CoA hydrolase